MTRLTNNANSRVLKTADLLAFYGLTRWDIRHGRETGFIQAVKAPTFVRHGNAYIVTEYEMTLFKARVKEFDRLFLNAARMTRLIGSRCGGKKYELNVDAQLIGRMEPYFGVMPPHSYIFKGLKGARHWHIEDLQTFQRFIGQALSEELDETNPCWDSDKNVWRPYYRSPPSFPEQYSDATKKRVLGKS